MKRGYTIIEILVVLAMIGLLAGFGIPAFQNYGQRSVFNQKVDEVKELMNEAYMSAKNPSSSDLSITNYIITYDKTGEGAGLPNKFVLSKCGNVVNVDGTCNGSSLVKSVELTKGQIIQQCQGSGTSICHIVCSTDPAATPSTCTYGFTTSLSFTDSNINPTKTVFFNIQPTPTFSVNVTYVDN